MVLCTTEAMGQGFLERLDLGIDKIKYSQLDTNYIAAPKYKLMVAVESKNFWGKDNIYIPFSWNDPEIYAEYPGLEKYETENILAHSHQNSVNLKVSYKGFAASYGFAFNSKDGRKYFSLSSLGNTFGFNLGFERNSLSNARFRDYRYLPFMYEFLKMLYEAGAIEKIYTIDQIAQHSVFERSDIISTDDEELIGENDGWELDDILHWYANFYYAFNHKHFSMAAARYGNYIQKRSAGSFFVTGDVNYSRLHAHDLLNVSEDSIRTSRENFSSLSVALGVGYGYNWTPNEGRLLLHASLRPMVNVFTRMDYKAYDWVHDAEGNVVRQEMPRINELAPLYDHKMKLDLGGVARVAAVWSITDQWVAGAHAEYTLRDNRNSRNYRMYNSRLHVNAFLGLRLLRDRRR